MQADDQQAQLREQIDAVAAKDPTTVSVAAEIRRLLTELP